jgi:aminoglycoside 3-N-acetyltransferase
MSELATISRTGIPGTRQQIVIDLRNLGVQPGMTLLVHSSLSAIGWIAGGPVAVIQALMDVLTPDGMLVMPTFSSDYSDPTPWQHPPVPESWHPIIREHMPAFDPDVTPSRQMGRIAETFRTWPGVRRSYHPHVSFAAWGSRTELITGSHSLDYPLGERSPLARIYDLDGWVLLLGVGFGNNTSFHLAEYRVPDPPQELNGGPILENGERVWMSYRDVAVDDEPFPDIGVDFERTDAVKQGHVGYADVRLFRQRSAVDYAVTWLTKKRPM